MDYRRWLEPSVKFISEAGVLGAGIVLPLVSIAFVAIRFYVRRHKETSLGIDDWLIAIGVLMITGIGVCFITGEELGVMGHPTPAPLDTIAADEYAQYLATQGKIEFSIQILACFAHVCVKASIVFFARRIFVGHRGSIFDWVSWALIALAIAWSVTFLVTVIITCGKDISLRWKPRQFSDGPRCDPSRPQEVFVITNFLLDVFIIILPIPSVWTLNMSWGKKLAVTGMFLVGLMALAASATQLVIYFLVLYHAHGSGIDMNEAITTMLWLSMLETSLAAIASCLPSLTVLAKGTRVRNFSYRLSNGVSHSGWLPLWKTSSESKRRKNPGDNSFVNNSYALDSRGRGEVQVISQRVFLRKGGSPV